MPYLPSELWLQILSYTTSPQDLWLSVRRTNSQLKACVEQHFVDHVIPTVKLELHFGLPCYDGRNPLRGKALFSFSHLEPSPNVADTGRIVCRLVGVEPEHYMEQLLVRWERLRESCKGDLPGSLEWRMGIDEEYDGGEGRKEAPVKLKEPVAFSNGMKTVDVDGAGNGVMFEWRATMTTFFL